MKNKKIIIPIVIITILIAILMIITNKSTRYTKLFISEDKWNEIINSRENSNDIKINDISFNDYKLVVDRKTSTIYYSLVNGSSLKYDPKVVYNLSNEDAKIAILSDEITNDKVNNNYLFKIIVYNDKNYHIYNLKCTNLPIININYDNMGKRKKDKININFYLFDNLINSTKRVIKSKGQLNVFENEYGFNDYVFSLIMLTPGKNFRENKISIFGMPPSSIYKLTRVDNNLNGETKHLAELFVNNEYIGLYGIEPELIRH